MRLFEFPEKVGLGLGVLGLLQLKRCVDGPCQVGSYVNSKELEALHPLNLQETDVGQGQQGGQT